MRQASGEFYDARGPMLRGGEGAVNRVGRVFLTVTVLSVVTLCFKKHPVGHAQLTSI
jgi:hypothetical protein